MKELKMYNRLYNDYFMPNRYKEYENLLKLFLENNYQFICVKDYKALERNGKYIIIRHDIDSDLRIAKKMFEIEKNLNINTTYYFRLNTMEKDFMTNINNFGSEVGYHYEEIAQFCKNNKKVNAEYVKSNIKIIRDNFIKNIKDIEKIYKIKLYSIASHGDFVNRKLGMTNKYLYNDELQRRLNLIEAYDIEKWINFRTADDEYPKFWKENPEKAIKNNKNKVLLLIHTRYWDKAPIERFKIDFIRLRDAIKLIK
jgi:hypothetical protein